MKVGIYTLGCKVNIYESEYIMSLFKDKGHIIEDFNDKCDVYIINTCTVTNNSDLKSKKIIRSARRKNKNACIVAMGCYTENNKDDLIDEIDLAIGNSNKSKIVELVEEYIKEKNRIEKFDDITNIPFENMEIKHLNSKTRAFVKIEDGCNNFCTYCIIPYVRGRCRSKNKGEVLKEINELVCNGYKEIVLTGIHTGNYGKDINTSLSDLLEGLLKIDNLQRIRLSSIEITELDDKFFKLLENKKICNHLHIPLQSGSDKILKLMNRKYTKNYFLKIVNKIRTIRPDISLTTDVIVGFPSENDKDFLESINFIEKIKFAKIHVFPYSKRDKTIAATMDNQVEEKVKKIRVKELINLSKKLENDYFNKFINQSLDVLIEKIKDSYSYGHTSNYLYLKIKENLKINEIYNVRIEKNMKAGD